RRQAQVQPETIGGQPEMRDAPVTGAAHQNSKNYWVQMKVEMAVDVVEGQAGHAESFKLRVDFALELRSQFRPKKVANAARHRMAAEIPAGINQAGNGARRQRRGSANQTDVQADTEPRILPRQFDGFVRSLAIDHQTGGGEDAFAMRAHDGVIDGRRTAEVVGVDDEPAGRAHVEFRVILLLRSHWNRQNSAAT